MDLLEFGEKINKDFLKENINEMIGLTVPYPITLHKFLPSQELEDNLNALYVLKAKTNVPFYNALKHIDFDVGIDDYYEYEYYLLLEYVKKLPKFKELIKR